MDEAAALFTDSALSVVWLLCMEAAGFAKTRAVSYAIGYKLNNARNAGYATYVTAWSRVLSLASAMLDSGLASARLVALLVEAVGQDPPW